VSAILAIDLGKFNSVFCLYGGQLHRRAKELSYEVVKKADAASDGPLSAPVLSA